MKYIKDKPEIWPYLVASLAIHLLLVLLAPKVIDSPIYNESAIEVVPIVEQDNESDGYQIADIARPKHESKPKSAKFIGQYDSEVSEEMVNGAPGSDKDRSKGVRSVRIGESSPTPKRASPKRDLLAFDKGLFDGNRKPVKEQTGDEVGSGSKHADDFYPDLKRGDRTYLNVLRYPDIDYFVRLKRAFKVAFNPIPSLRNYFSQNRIAKGSVDVVLGVSVDRGGNIAELFVFTSSGIPSYDDEALRTVRSSAPFTSPPAKFTADDGMLRMSWTFSVYM